MELDMDHWSSEWTMTPLFEGLIGAGPADSFDGSGGDEAIFAQDYEALAGFPPCVNHKESIGDSYDDIDRFIIRTSSDDLFTDNPASALVSCPPQIRLHPSPHPPHHTDHYCPDSGSLSPAPYSNLSSPAAPSPAPICPSSPAVLPYELPTSPINNLEYGDIDYFLNVNNDDVQLLQTGFDDQLDSNQTSFEQFGCGFPSSESFVGLESQDDEAIAAGFLQEVPDGNPSSPLDDVDDRSMEDPTAVCEMLQKLNNEEMLKVIVGHLLSAPLSPVSLDDLDSILSSDPATSDTSSIIGVCDGSVASSGFFSGFSGSSSHLNVSNQQSVSILSSALGGSNASHGINTHGVLLATPLTYTENKMSKSVSCGSMSSFIVGSYSSSDIAMSPPSVLSVESVDYDTMSLGDDVAITFGYDYLAHDVKPKIASSQENPARGFPAREYLPTDRREKKKKQNKTAALRYRQKKREEKGTVFTEVELLEQRNGELKERVTELSREINYLKGLMEEICQQE